MTTLILQRIRTNADCTLGMLSYGNLALSTLEPQGVDLTVKPRCIHAGTYRIVRYNSPKHGPNTLFLLDVPDFEYVEIHIGNYPRDSQGCILVGLDIAGEAIEHSRQALAELNDILSDSSDISLTISDPVLT